MMLINPAILGEGDKILYWAKDYQYNQIEIFTIIKRTFCLHRIISIHNLLPQDQNNSMIWDYKKKREMLV